MNELVTTSFAMVASIGACRPPPARLV